MVIIIVILIIIIVITIIIIIIIIVIVIKSFLMVEPCLIWNRLLSELQFDDLRTKLSGQSIELFSYMAS